VTSPVTAFSSPLLTLYLFTLEEPARERERERERGPIVDVIVQSRGGLEVGKSKRNGRDPHMLGFALHNLHTHTRARAHVTRRR